MSKRFWPLAKGTYTLTSGFGPRWGTIHAGQDFAAKDGTPFYACQGGTVLYIGPADGYGQWIVLDHSDEDGAGVTEYGHMWNAFATGLKIGDRVEAGQLLGYVGSNGQSTGPHLHLSVMPREYNPAKKINPMSWLANAAYPAAPAPKPPSPAPAQEGKHVPNFTMKEIDLTGSHSSHSSRWGARPWGFVFHTQEGPGSARSLHDYFSRAQVSYHYTVDDKELVGSVNTDRASWSVLDANPYTINLCFAGSRAAMSREEWLTKYGNAIDLAAQVAVRDCRQYGIKIQVLARDYAKIKQRTPGIFDHSGITHGLGIGDHSDVGPNFPWDVFTERVRFWAEGGTVPAPAPVINAIDEEAKTASSWIGKRLTAGEGDAIDGGKYAHFENGSIYWHARTGAWAIPKSIFEKYSEMRWEQSFLGFPIGRHTVLTVPVTGQPWGDVQGFEGGAIYRKYGQPGYVVTGAIRERWNRTGFEQGDFGWPTSDEVKLAGGEVKQTFERGVIVWSPDGTVALKPVDGPDEIVQPAH